MEAFATSDQSADQFRLSLVRNRAIGAERRDNRVVPKVLRPGLKLFAGLAHLIAVLDQRLAEVKRRKNGQASVGESALDDLTDGRSAAVDIARQSGLNSP